MLSQPEDLIEPVIHAGKRQAAGANLAMGACAFTLQGCD
jgi:hypothetical protein